jgi:hypothetical protein
MAEDFDPYYKWLAIPPSEQPPHHYRLLGIELFETDHEVIKNAAKLRCLHIRSFQNEKFAMVAAKLQKKIVAAKICLLDPASKAEYDALLRQKLSLPKAQPLAAKPKLSSSKEILPAPAPPPPPPSPQIISELDALKQTQHSQYVNTDYTLNPIIIAKETIEWCRQHRRVMSTSVKLGCAAVGIVILLIVVANIRTLLPFFIDKSSAVIGKVTGSNEAAPPERIARTRSDPGAKGEDSDTPAKSSRRASVVPPPPKDESLAPSATTVAVENPQPTVANPAAEPVAADSSTDINVLNLPSEKSFRSRLFKTNINPVIDSLKESIDSIKDAAKDDRIVFLDDPFGRIYAFAEQKKGVVDGISMTLNANGQPITYAVYADGLLDGIVKTWNDKGDKVYWCQFEKGVRQGFCCYFKGNSLRLLLEIENDKPVAIHLCANGELKKSFTSVDEVAADKETQQLFVELTDMEAELKDNDAAFKKLIKDEELRQRRERKPSLMTAQKKAMLQEQHIRLTSQIQRIIQTLWQYKGW